MALFDADGRPAAVSGDVRKEEARVAEWFRADLHAFKWRASSDSGIVLAPGEVDLRVVDLTKWFDVKVPGEYSLVVGRYLHFAYSGDPRVVMSNLAKITIAR